MGNDREQAANYLNVRRAHWDEVARKKDIRDLEFYLGDLNNLVSVTAAKNLIAAKKRIKNEKYMKKKKKKKKKKRRK